MDGMKALIDGSHLRLFVLQDLSYLGVLRV